MVNKIVKLKTKNEFEKLLFRLKDIEYDGLRESFAEKGFDVNDGKIKVWEGFIADGHHRKKICDELKIKIKDEWIDSEELKDKTENEVKIWILINQYKRRRNLSTEEKYLIIAKLSELNEIGKYDKRSQSGKFTVNLDPKSTDKDVITKTAEELGVSKSIVDTARKYKRITDENPECREDAKKEEKKTPNKVIKEYKNQKKKEKQKKESKKLTKEFTLEKDKVIVKHGSFQEIAKDIKDNSIDCIIIDFTYQEEFLPLWNDLSKVAARVLKPG